VGHHAALVLHSHPMQWRTKLLFLCYQRGITR
jgi:hypothetical protein